MNIQDAYYKWLGIRPTEQLTHYRLLGIPAYETDPQVITHAADRQMSFVKQFATGPHTHLTQQILTQLAQARLTLLDPIKKAAYDQTLTLNTPPTLLIVPPTTPTPAPETPPRRYRTHTYRPKRKTFSQYITHYAAPLALTFALISVLALAVIYTQIKHPTPTQTAQTKNKTHNDLEPLKEPQPINDPQPPLNLNHKQRPPRDPLTLEPLDPNTTHPRTPILGDFLNDPPTNPRRNNPPVTALNDPRLNDPDRNNSLTEETNTEPPPQQETQTYPPKFLNFLTEELVHEFIRKHPEYTGTVMTSGEFLLDPQNPLIFKSIKEAEEYLARLQQETNPDETETTEENTEETPNTPLRTQRNNIAKQITHQELSQAGLTDLTTIITYQPNNPQTPNTTYVRFHGTLNIMTIAVLQAQHGQPNLLTTLQNLQKQNPDRTISWLGRINKKTGKLTLDSQKIFTATDTNMQEIIEDIIKTTGQRLATLHAEAYKQTPYPELPHTATVQPNQ